MNFLEKNDQGALIQYLLHNETGMTLPTPFERDIYLFDTYVAGTTHIEGIDDLAASLRDGDRLVFYREPDNPHDPQAIRIETLEEEKIGYVPRRDNVVFSRLMDAGKLLFATIAAKEMRGNWLKVDIKIYLHES